MTQELSPEEVWKTLSKLTIKSDTEVVRQLLRSILRSEEDWPKASRAEIRANVKRRLDLTSEDLEKYLTNPDTYKGVVWKCGRHLHGGWLARYLEYTEGHEAPEEFHFWVAVSVVGSALGRNIFFDKGYYQVFPNHYIVLVAPPGRCRGSTSIDIGVWFLRRIEDIKIISEKITPEALAVTLATNRKWEGGVMSVNSVGLICAPELTVFLGKQQYNEGLLILLTRLYDCPAEWEYETRKTQEGSKAGKVRLRNVALSLIGKTTPASFVDAISNVSYAGGFMSRVMCIVKEDTPRIYALPKIARTDLRDLLLEGLIRIHATKGQFVFAPGAEEFHKEWYESNRIIAAQHDHRMAYYYERKPDHLLRLSMVMAASEGDDMLITTNIQQRALLLLEVVEAAMPDAFTELEATSSGRENIKVLNIIKRKGGIISRKELSHILARHMNSRQLDDVVRTLKDGGWIVEEVIKGSTFYTLQKGEQ